MKKPDTLTFVARDGFLQSPWQENLKRTPKNANKKLASTSVVYDCAIIGAGITGLTTALLLQRSGKRTILLDAHTVGFGSSGGTSAHINTFADTTFNEAEKAFGVEGAQLFADAIKEGFELIKQQVDQFRIDCDYERKPAYLYAETDDEVELLADIYKGALKVGVPVIYEQHVPTPIPYQKALRFDGQAQFHPLKYLEGLKAAYLLAGGTIQENTLVEKVENANGVFTAMNAGRTARAKAIVYATHMPPNLNVFNFECAPYRSYVLAVKLKSGKYPDALIYDCQEPYHYVRAHQIGGEPLLLVGGVDHKAGHEDSGKAFDELEKYVRKHYHVSSIKYRWSSQYYVPVDGLPYVGKMPLAPEGIYCATGYNGNGMMLGSVAGKILCDLLTGKRSKYQKIFEPSRIKPIDGFSEFVKENADVAYHFVADRFGIHETDSLKRIVPGTGKVVEVDGKKIAAYRDENGIVHALGPVCTHAGCIVNWNGAERSWDCPCHGARYDINGKVITGPATKNLLTIINSSDK